MVDEPVVDTLDPEPAIDQLVAAASKGPTAVESQMGAVIALRYREVERLAHSFGTGPHYCLGANLARMILEETIAGFVGREVSLVDEPARWRAVLGRSPADLPVHVKALA